MPILPAGAPTTRNDCDPADLESLGRTAHTDEERHEHGLAGEKDEARERKAGEAQDERTPAPDSVGDRTSDEPEKPADEQLRGHDERGERRRLMKLPLDVDWKQRADRAGRDADEKVEAEEDDESPVEAEEALTRDARGGSAASVGSGHRPPAEA